MLNLLRTLLGTWTDKILGKFLHYNKQWIVHIFFRHWTKLVMIVFWTFCLVAFYRYKKHAGINNVGVLEDVYNFLSHHTYGLALYMLIFLIRPVLFFPASGIIFLSGILYWVGGGFFYTFLGMNLSAGISYWIGRFLTHKKHTHDLDIPESWIDTTHQKSWFDAGLTMMMTRLIFLHFDITNYVAGAKKVQWWGYMLGTAIGIIPDIMIFVLAGASFSHNRKGDIDFHHIHPQGKLLILSILLFIACLIGAQMIRMYQKKRKTTAPLSSRAG